jgi:hypothetical protein
MPGHCDSARTYRPMRPHAGCHAQRSLVIGPGPDQSSPSQTTVATAKASGSADRSFSPKSVRYMSVTSVVQRRLLTADDRG